MFYRPLLSTLGFLLMIVFVTLVLPAMMTPGLMAAADIGLPLESAMNEQIGSALIWMKVILLMFPAGIVASMLVSSVQDYRALAAHAETPPQTLKDHFLLAAEHDSAIAYAGRVLGMLDEAIETKWPEQNRKR